ncbi:hypothetical protein LJ739_18690 [Aestuariibacter halophilus]|uniref:Tail specific protease domain-containing protein n=1 Tax=Fluctibacter halophilus TaxID=226011 RepID=A0ABS8GDV5_9ALTE|nr:S41 family peptidase [Aestuariibacter halophilus]MCC2618291.1 hypothetical protein [Aestuariibacter halophilus]
MTFNLKPFGALLCATLLAVTCRADADDKTYTHKQVVDDFEVLYQSLIDTHYNPYAYITEAALKNKYLTLKQQLTAQSYPPLAAINVFQQLVASLNNGHTEIDFPAGPYVDYAEAGGTLFPLELVFEKGAAYVRADYSDNPKIAIGAELIAINGVPIADILQQIYPLISAERTYFKNAKLEVYTFPRYYWYAFGRQDNFTVSVRTENGLQSHQLTAIPVIDGFEAKKDEILRAQQELTFYPRAAYLNPGHFSGKLAQYQQFVDQAFQQINAAQVDNLIIDLRNNSGGDDAFSDYLVAYLADKPFKWHAEFHLRSSALLKRDTEQKRDLTNPYWRSIMTHEDGARYAFEFEPYTPVPEQQRYTGNVYVLVNRQSHSQASVTAAQIQDHGWGVVVGEETGDYPTLYASQFQYPLPNTGITVKIAKGYIVRVSGSEQQQGVVPDIAINDHLLDNEDEILQGLLQRLNGEGGE